MWAPYNIVVYLFPAMIRLPVRIPISASKNGHFREIALIFLRIGDRRGGIGTSFADINL